jgi:hypothetical protein
MELKLIRLLERGDATGGILLLHKLPVCYTIEPPWLGNERNKSCIPEGMYDLYPRWRDWRGWHIGVRDVPNRSNIIFHPGNFGKDTKGCILPNTELHCAGLSVWGAKSRQATRVLNGLILQSLRTGDVVRLEVASLVNV